MGAKVQAKDEVLMVDNSADLWNSPAFYVVRKDLKVTVMVHIPVAKRASFKYLFFFTGMNRLLCLRLVLITTFWLTQNKPYYPSTGQPIRLGLSQMRI